MPEKIVLEQDKNIKTKEVERPVDTPADFTSPEVLYQDLITEIKKYHPSSDLSDIEKAYKVAYKAHEGQKRKSGEPYIIHPLCVAIILAELELDKESIIAGLLHDVVEDTVMTSEDVGKEFGSEVALLVDGVTKLTQLNYEHDKIEVQAENLRKMFLAMAKDIRVIMIKLADRLHNMRTMQYQSPAKQIEKSRETMEIYAPIAHRLGISKVCKTGYEKTDKSSENLQNAIDKLAGEKSTLFKDARESKDTSKVTAAAQELIDKYNSLIEAMSKTSSSLDEFYKKALKGLPESIKESLEKVGITYNNDGTLEIDSDKLKKADIDSLEKIFGSDSEFMKKLSFVTDRIESNAEANLQSVSSTYSSTADIMSSFNSSKYDFLG